MVQSTNQLNEVIVSANKENNVQNVKMEIFQKGGKGTINLEKNNFILELEFPNYGKED